MGDKKPAPPLGTIHSKVVPTGGRPPPGSGERLDSLNPSRDANIGATAKPAPVQFKPNIVSRVKKEPTKGDDIDKKLEGHMPNLLDESKFLQERITARYKPPVKSAGRGTDTKSALKSPFMGGASGGAASKIKKDKDEEMGDALDFVGGPSISLKKNELEIDSSNPNHPSVVPFVDPHRQKELDAMRAKDKQEDIIMTEIKQEIAMLDKEEEEKAGPEVLISTLDIPTPLMADGDFLNEDNFFFIQLPSSLPFTPPPPSTADSNNNNNTPNTNTNKESNNNNTTTATPNPPSTAPQPGQRPPQKNPNEYVNTMRGVNGHLGKIVVYKSGKTKLKIGDVLYDITAANNPNFLEELMVLEPESCYRVGPMSQHLIVTPDIEDLLEKADKKA